jgi:hypothetical protein
LSLIGSFVGILDRTSGPERDRSIPMDTVVITDPAGSSSFVGTGRAVLVAGVDAEAVGTAVAALRAAGSDAAAWVGDPSDAAVREMAAELFPGRSVVVASAG